MQNPVWCNMVELASKEVQEAAHEGMDWQAEPPPEVSWAHDVLIGAGLWWNLPGRDAHLQIYEHGEVILISIDLALRYHGRKPLPCGFGRSTPWFCSSFEGPLFLYPLVDLDGGFKPKTCLPLSLLVLAIGSESTGAKGTKWRRGGGLEMTEEVE